jgi:3-oxoacyl-[acyl-carrier-protein] synthase II
VKRVFARGAKGAVPAHFPNLVPSSPVAHAAIYLRLGGPVLSSADLAATAEGAIATAAQLIAAGEGELIAAGSVEELSAIADRVLGPLCTGRPAPGPRSEGSAVLVLESPSSLRARSEQLGQPLRALAELDWIGEWRGEPGDALESIPSPAECGRTVVLLGQASELARTVLGHIGWGDVPWHAVAPRSGYHDGAGGFAAAAAVAEIACGRVDSALVLGLGRDRGYALLLRAPRPVGEEP